MNERQLKLQPTHHSSNLIVVKINLRLKIAETLPRVHEHLGKFHAENDVVRASSPFPARALLRHHLISIYRVRLIVLVAAAIIVVLVGVDDVLAADDVPARLERFGQANSGRIGVAAAR